jgi:hypothetical protein
MFLAILDLQWEWEGSGKEGKQVELQKRSRRLIYHYYRGAIGVFIFLEQRGAIGVEKCYYTRKKV